MTAILWLIRYFQVIVAMSLCTMMVVMAIYVIYKLRVSHVHKVHGKTIISKPNIIQMDIDDPVVIAEMEKLEELLDITNRQITQQRELLDILAKAYDSSYDDVEKNKILGNILKTKATIIKLTGKSDKLGFDINKLGRDWYYANK